MFDSGIRVSDLIAQIKEEADIAIPITDESFVQWLNALEQLLYTEVIQEQKRCTIDLTRYLIDLSLAYPNLKLNFWPLFDSQKIGDAVLEVSEDGTYNLRINNSFGTTGEGAVFQKKITLRRGTYTLSDNSRAFTGGMPDTIKRTYIADAATGTVLAGLSFTAAPEASASFTLENDTEVICCIRVLEHLNYGTSGSTIWPQLEPGSTKTQTFIPPVILALTTDIPVVSCNLPTAANEATMRFEDIHAVYADEVQMIKSTPTSGPIFPDAYFKNGDKLGLHFSIIPNNLEVVYKVRPALKTVTKISSDTVKLPPEFINLATAKLRGEAYKLANEDNLAAKWLNDYNILLETFKAWAADKQPEFGM